MKEYQNFYKGTGTDADPIEWSDPRSMIAERSLAFTPRVTKGIKPEDEFKGHFINNMHGREVNYYERKI